MWPNGCDCLTALLEKGTLRCCGHSTLKTRPGKMPDKRHFLSSASKREEQFIATGQRNKTLLPSVVFSSFYIPNQVQNHTMERTIKKHFQAQADRGINLSPALRRRIEVLRVLSETKAGTAAEPRCPRMN